MLDALERLHAANALGWGAYFGMATRRSGLSRWQRGDMKALVEVPAIIVDIDEAPDAVLSRIRDFPLTPSCIIASGHGVHVYWALSVPMRDFQGVNAIHRSIASALKGDYLTAATALRLPGSRNTKHNESANCEVLESDWSIRYSMTDFAIYRNASELRKRRKNDRHSHSGVHATRPDTQYIQDVTNALLLQGFKWRDTWLNGSCPNAYQHKHADRRPSFGFNTATGWGYCFVCGTMQPEIICRTLSVAYG